MWTSSSQGSRRRSACGSARAQENIPYVGYAVPGVTDPPLPKALSLSLQVIDHSVQVDVSRTADALEKNQEIEFDRNRERFAFLKWGQQAFNNMTIVPPGTRTSQLRSFVGEREGAIC